MSTIILNPNAVGSNSNLSSVPAEAANLNWNKINTYPDHLFFDRYIYSLNGSNEDSYSLNNLVNDLSIKINSVSVFTKCAKDIITDICTAEPAVYISGSFYRSATVNTLDLIFSDYSYSWTQNPDTNSFWTITDINTLEIGLRLISAGAASKASCSQVFASLDISILNEIVSNVIISDTIHLNQDFTIVAAEDMGRSLYDATTVQIEYKKPDKTEGTLTGNVIDENRIIAKFPAGSNDIKGKYWFKLYAILSSGEILEGVPFFANVQPKWV